MLSLVGPKSSGGCYGYPRLPACAGAKHQWRQLRQCVPRRGAGESVAQRSYLVDKSKRRAVVSATCAAVTPETDPETTGFDDVSSFVVRVRFLCGVDVTAVVVGSLGPRFSLSNPRVVA